MADIMRREAALQSSDLPECQWVRAQFKDPPENGAVDAKRLHRSLAAHTAGCEICAARERYAMQRFGPPPVTAPHRSGAYKALDMLESVWSVAVWLVFILVAASSGMFREPITWIILALPVAIYGSRLWRSK
jgi:hypothetical protein